MFSLKDKTAVITGGGSGIGKAMSVLFAKQGANVFILDIDDKGALETAGSIPGGSGKAVYKKCSVAVKEEVDTVIQQIGSEKGRIDIVINNAGIAHVGNTENTQPADMEKLIAVNIKGVYHVLQAALPFMKEHGGVVLNLSSIAAMVGLADRFAYSMTKGAVAAMTLSFAKDYMAHNIRCNCIAPARVHTPFVDGFLKKNYPGHEEEMFKKLSATQPIGRMAKPDEIAALALYLCSDEASFITGCNYPIDGGFTTLNS
jgi:NAD(P)-dependent dehydrogenase (short-subunit alcohol dehydrogenase family)